MSETYTIQVDGGISRGSDGATIPPDTSNTDYRDYQAWVAAGGVATPYVTRAPVFTCQLWQLQAVLTTTQWEQIAAAVSALNSPTVSAFFAHGTNSIPSDSTTLLGLAGGIGLTSDQVTDLVVQASAISIP